MRRFMPDLATLELAVTVAFGLFTAAFLWDTFRLPERAGLFPRIVGVPTLALIVILTVILASAKRAAPASDAPTVKGARMTWVATVASLLLYYFGVEIIGFVLATFIYTLIVPFLLGQRKRLPAVTLAFVCSGFLVILFTYLLRLDLPAGLIYNALFG